MLNGGNRPGPEPGAVHNARVHLLTPIVREDGTAARVKEGKIFE